MLRAPLGAFRGQERGKHLSTSTGGARAAGKRLCDHLSVIGSGGFPGKGFEPLGEEKFSVREGGLCGGFATDRLDCSQNLVMHLET